VCGELADGRPLTLQDGRTIDPEDVLGPPAQGTKLVVGGDTETTGGLSAHVRDADLLVIEATFLERDAAMAGDYGHLTAARTAKLGSPFFVFSLSSAETMLGGQIKAGTVSDPGTTEGESLF
jgi:ribonuclease Z